jgi:hypothetical protein
MLIIQLGLILLCCLGLGVLIFMLLKKFGRTDLAIYYFAPVFMYCLGFGLRLSGIGWLVDIGYFFTDGALIAIYLVFSIAMLLGQIKYWKK